MKDIKECQSEILDLLSDLSLDKIDMIIESDEKSAGTFSHNHTGGLHSIGGGGLHID